METGKVGSYSVYETYVKYVINKQRRRTTVVASGLIDQILKWIFGF